MHVLHDYKVLNGEYINAFPRWESASKWLFPQSHLVRSVTEPTLTALFGDDEETRLLAAGRAEFRIALAQHLWPGTYYHRRPSPGEFIMERHWDHDEGLRWIEDLRSHGDPAPWGIEIATDGFTEGSSAVLATLVDGLSRSRRFY